MKEILQKMIEKAMDKHGGQTIVPPCHLKNWDTCLTVEPEVNSIFFWYNIGPDTYTITEPMEAQ